MKYLVIGNGVAGISAAEAIRNSDKSAEITVLNSERYYHYSRPRVIEFLSGRTPLEKITIKNADFYEKNYIRLVMLVNVIKIDVIAKKVLLEGGIEEDYDRLIIAAGANSFMPPVPGSDYEGVFTLRTIDDAKAIMEYAKGKNTALLIGGGLLGIEAAMSLTALGLKTTIVEFFDRLLPRQLDSEGAAMLKAKLEEKGLKFLLPRQTASIEKTAGGLKANFKDNTHAEAGLILFSAGIRPNLKIIEGTGILADKGIKVNNYMETSVRDVYACGDITEYNGMVYGIWPAAKEQGTIAGQNAAGGRVEYKGSVLSTKLKVAGIELGSLGSVEPGEGIEVYTEKTDAVFKRLYIKEGRLAGAILLGDASAYQKLQEAMKNQVIIKEPKSLL
ncbi:MAG TPA: FAD-dependent oxidoreductase [Candidatus Goldiibacteriota bacterium]|nr:FAD-dependent oxidoreductase [Candidatus Goldiibacteriota bacterium]